MQNFFTPRTSPGSQLSIKSALATKERIHHAHLCVPRWWFDANIWFNATSSKYYQDLMWDAVTAIGPGYKGPTFL